MSWAGEVANEADVPDLSREMQRSLQDVRCQGVIHGDEREANMLWNAERRRVMIIDFERSRLLPTAKNKAVEELSSRKRKRLTKFPEVYPRKRVLRDGILNH